MFPGKRLLPIAIATLGMTVQSPAHAQLEEVVVTATKRQATLQDIPIAVSVVDRGSYGAIPSTGH